MADSPDAKPAILKDEAFVIQEGVLYRAARTGAIWMNKLFFGACVLLAIWLLVAYARDDPGCTTLSNGTSCSAFLNPTSLYLGGMAIVTFGLSLAFGAVGLVVGKQVLAASAVRAQDEVGARRDEPKPPQGGT